MADITTSLPPISGFPKDGEITVENFDSFFPPPPPPPPGIHNSPSQIRKGDIEEYEFGTSPTLRQLVRNLMEVAAPTEDLRRCMFKAVVLYHLAEEFADFEYDPRLLLLAAGSYELGCEFLGGAYVYDFLDTYKLL